MYAHSVRIVILVIVPGTHFHRKEQYSDKMPLHRTNAAAAAQTGVFHFAVKHQTLVASRREEQRRAPVSPNPRAARVRATVAGKKHGPTPEVRVQTKTDSRGPGLARRARWVSGHCPEPRISALSKGTALSEGLMALPN